MKRLAALGLALAGAVSAADLTWQGPVGGDGAWNTTNYWSGNAVPTAADKAYIYGGRTAVIGEGTAVEGTGIYLANGNNGTGTLRLDGGTVTNVLMYVGNANTSASNTGRLEIIRGSYVTTNTLTVGNGAGYGWVGLTGGEVSNAIVNMPAKQGWFVQDGGTNRTVSLRVGTGGSGTQNRFTLNGGLLDVSSGVVVGYGGYGYMEVNGGMMTPTAAFQVPLNTYDLGELVLNRYTNTIKSLALATDGNNRHSYTGLVTMTGCNITVPTLSMAGNLSNSYARVLVDGGRFWVSNSLAIGNDTDNPLGKRAILIVTNGATLLVSVAETDIYNSSSKNLTVANGGELRIYGGTVLVSDRLFMNAGGIVEMTGGVFTPKRVYSGGNGLSAPFIFYMKGGLLYIPPTLSQFYLGGDGNSMPSTYSQCPVTFVQTGGVVSNSSSTVIISRGSTNYVSRYEISGGALAPNLSFQINTNGVSELCVKGSAADLTMSYIYDPYASSFLLECVLDKSLGHLSPLRFDSNGYRCGHLRVRLDGGVLLSATNAFTVMKKRSGTFSNTRNYLTVPDTSLWATSLVAGATEAAVTLTGKQADLVLHGQQNATFGAVPMGYVTVGNIATNFLVELIVRMRATAADGSALTTEGLNALVGGLVGAGYTNSAAEVAGIYNLKVAVPLESVVPGGACFAWDFTRTAGIKTVGVVTTNALVSAVSVESVKGFGTGTLFFIQ